MAWYDEYKKITECEHSYFVIDGKLEPVYFKYTESGRGRNWHLNTYYYHKIDDKYKRVFKKDLYLKEGGHQILNYHE